MSLGQEGELCEKKKVNRAGFDTVYSGRNFPEVIEERVDYTFKGDDEGVVFL